MNPTVLFCMLASFLVLIPVAMECFAQNCNENTEGKRECLRVPGYNGFQYARCSSHIFIQNVSHGIDSCTLGKNTSANNVDDEFCWYPCQREMHNRMDGAVSSDCKCRDNDEPDGNDEWTYDYTQYTANKNNDVIDPDMLKTIRNCSYLRDSDRICFHDKRYTQSQWLTCRSSSYVYQKTRGSFRCDPERLYCWIPCEKENSGSVDGDVSKDCLCGENVDGDDVISPKNSAAIVGVGGGSKVLSSSSMMMLSSAIITFHCIYSSTLPL